ncbi:DUF305 domain-containing protein [Williamsia sp. SKLECPSW1]
MDSTGNPQTEPAPASDPRPGWRRQVPALIGLGVVALLLVGFGVGLLVGRTVPSDDAAAPASDSAAVGFAQDMSEHHAQAVSMAAIEMDRGTDEQVRSLAFDILTSQSNQIGQMQSWLQRWGRPLTSMQPAMSWMTGDNAMGMGVSMTAGDGVTTPIMPGMATEPELRRLRSSTGSALDTYFLQLMLRHHQGGRHMMEYAVDPEHVSQDYVRDLAQQMNNVQSTEADTMTQMLAERGQTPLPMN